jgi:hypothetical protein
MLGCPGFPDGWQARTHKDPATGGLYALNGIRPVISRAPAYVDVDSIEMPDVLDQPKYLFVIDEFPNQVIPGTCFVDKFDQPILYYRARSGGSSLVSDIDIGNGGGTGIYNMDDNALITGTSLDTSGNGDPVKEGIDLGAGTNHFNRKLSASTWPPPPGDWCFAYTIYNPKTVSPPRPHKADSYILLSAGPDGLYGTGDDIANFPINE